MKHFSIFFLLLFTLLSQAQTKDSITDRAIAVITSKFPLTRAFDLQYEQLGGGKFDSKIFKEPFQKGRFSSHQKLKIAANVPFYKNQRLILSGTFRYKYENFNTDYISDVSPYSTGQNILSKYHNLTGAVNATYFSTLFKKTIIYNGTGIVEGNEKSVQRLKGLVSAIIVLKKTQRTTITTGLVAFVDVSAIIPIAPIFTWEHQFENSQWSLDLLSPHHLYFRRNMFQDGRLTIGAELNSENFYLDFSGTELHGMYEYNQLEVKSGITYEHNLGHNIFLNFKTGWNEFLTGRLTKRGEKTSKYILDIKQDGAPYFSVGISYNPFN